jgi:hypothetical protein
VQPTITSPERRRSRGRNDFIEIFIFNTDAILKLRFMPEVEKFTVYGLPFTVGLVFLKTPNI